MPFASRPPGWLAGLQGSGHILAGCQKLAPHTHAVVWSDDPGSAVFYYRGCRIARHMAHPSKHTECYLMDAHSISGRSPINRLNRIMTYVGCKVRFYTRRRIWIVHRPEVPRFRSGRRRRKHFAIAGVPWRLTLTPRGVIVACDA